MRFNLVDRIIEVQPGRLIRARKNLTLGEEYLADHFPSFPVLPGVLMLEALTQAAGWLLHVRHEFSRSFAVLKEARNVKYGHFVAPGNALQVEVDLIKTTGAGATFKAIGTVGTAQALSARVELAYFDLGEKQPELAELDERLKEHHRRRWELIRPAQTPAPVIQEG